MPAFTFEKISSPIRSDAKPVVIAGNAKQASIRRSRSLIVDMMDRWTAARITRKADETKVETRPE